MPHPKH